MGKTFFIILLFLIALSVVGQFLLTDAGYLLLHWRGVTLETSVVLFVTCSLLCIIIVTPLMLSLIKTIGAGSRLRAWRQQRQNDKIGKKFTQGLLSLLQEDWQNADNALTSSGAHDDFVFASLWARATVAQKRGDYDTRDALMTELEARVGEKNQLSARLARASLYTEAAQWDRAIATLEALRDKHPKHPVIIRRLAQSYAQQRQWQPLNALLSDAKRLKAIPADDHKRYQEHLHLQKIDAAIQQAVENQSTATAMTPEPETAPTPSSPSISETQLTQQLIALWKQAPSTLNTASDSLLARIDALEKAHFFLAAQRLLEAVLPKSTDPRCLQRYGELRSIHHASRIDFLQNTLKNTPECPEYDYALGRQLALAKHWDKAKPLLEKSLRQRPTRACYHALAELYHETQQYEKSNAMYQKALQA